MKCVLLIGRVLFSSIFIIKALEHFSGHMIGYAEGIGVPMASVLVPLSGIVALAGGVSILLGYKAKIGAWLLALFLLLTACLVHKFWVAETSFAVMMHQYCFLKNLSMIGACLMIAYFGSGPMSLDKTKAK